MVMWPSSSDGRHGADKTLRLVIEFPELAAVVEEDAGADKVPVQAGIDRHKRRAGAHHLRGVFKQAATPRVVVIARRRRPAEFLAMFLEIGFRQQPQARVGDGFHERGDIGPIALQRRAAFGSAGEEVGDFLLLQGAHPEAVDVEAVLIPPEGAVHPHAIAVLQVVALFVGVAVLPNLEFFRAGAVANFDVEVGLARLGHALARLDDLARDLGLDGASVGEGELGNFLESHDLNKAGNGQLRRESFIGRRFRNPERVAITQPRVDVATSTLGK